MDELNRPSLKSALRPPPSALAESANFRPFYVKRTDFSPPPLATKKRRKLVKIRPLTDCKSLFLNIMIQVSQFVSNSQFCH